MARAEGAEIVRRAPAVDLVIRSTIAACRNSSRAPSTTAKPSEHRVPGRRRIRASRGAEHGGDRARQRRRLRHGAERSATSSAAFYVHALYAQRIPSRTVGEIHAEVERLADAGVARSPSSAKPECLSRRGAARAAMVPGAIARATRQAPGRRRADPPSSARSSTPS